MSLSLPVIFYANLLESYLDKIKYVHDYLCLSIDYDKTAFDSGDYGGKLQTAYSAVVSTRRCFSKWNFCQWRNAVGCPSRIPATGRPPLLVQAEFLRPAERRCSSKRNSRDRQAAVARPREIPVNGRRPLLVQAEFS